MEESHLKQSVSNLILEKMMVLEFACRCREIYSQNEFNNNDDLDNVCLPQIHKRYRNQEDSGNERGT